MTEHCYSCAAELPSDLKNVLSIKFDGGYGMFIDPIAEEMKAAPKRVPEIAPGVSKSVVVQSDRWTELEAVDYETFLYNLNRILICHDCAHLLCERVPWAKHLLNPHDSHSHSAEYHEQNPDHWGWDYDRRNEDDTDIPD